MTKQTAIVVCPGRGTYGQAEMGYLSRHFTQAPDIISIVDAVRREAGQVPISELDAMDSYSFAAHGTGDNASALIYACAMADFAAINRDKFEIVGITGNSMGWYLALAAGGAVSLENGARIVNGMGTLMHKQGTGGQIVYPVVDDDWRPDPAAIARVEQAVAEAEGQVHMSIHLGGMAVLAADEAGLKSLMKALPKSGNFPFQLRGHSAFHSPLLSSLKTNAKALFKSDLFELPTVPLVDGEGVIHTVMTAATDELYDYTFGRQIDETFGFSSAIDVCAKEFAPDVFIVLGPGTTLGAPVAQTLIAGSHYDLTGKAQFKSRQDTAPVILSMGMENQRKLAL